MAALLQSGPAMATPPELTVPECDARGKICPFLVYLAILSRNIRYIEHKNSDKIISKRNRRVYRCEMGLKQKDCHDALRNQQGAPLLGANFNSFACCRGKHRLQMTQ